MGKAAIDYHTLVADFQKKSRRADTTATSKRAFDDFLLAKLPDLWCDAYARMPGKRLDIVQVTDEYEFLFDLGCDRVVAAFGLTRYNPAPRDAERMSEFLGGTTSKTKLSQLEKSAPSKAEAKRRRHLAGLSFRERFFLTHGDRYDRGHFMSHRQGGGTDINLFPQLANVNQGKSVEGKVYRAMEKACVAHQGIFCFSRPIYTDDTWVPSELEYGVFHAPDNLEFRTFPNR